MCFVGLFSQAGVLEWKHLNHFLRRAEPNHCSINEMYSTPNLIMVTYTVGSWLTTKVRRGSSAILSVNENTAE